MLFGEVIKDLRKKRKLTQQELADQINNRFGQTLVNRGQISMWESKPSRQPEYDILNKLADFFEVDVSEFTGGNDQSLETLMDYLRKFELREIKDFDGSDLSDEDIEFFTANIKKHIRERLKNK